MKKRRKQSLLFGIILLMLGLGLGYAYLTTNLSIEGIADIDSNTWDVYWDNVQVTTGSVTGDQVTQAPTIDTNKTTVSFHVRLSQPGDYYEFTVDAVNDGSIDAMIDTINKTINNSTTVPEYLNYTVTYDDDIEITSNQLLASGDLETYKVRVEYRTDIETSQLPDTAQTLNLKFGIEYVQRESTATPVRTTIYNVSSTSFTIGNNVPEGVTTYDNYQDAVTAFGHPFFLRHTVANNTVVASYVGFVLNDNVYYLRGGVDEEYLSTQPVYEVNKMTLQTAFGENCSEYVNGNYKYYDCSDTASGVSGGADTNGNVYAYDGGYVCIVNVDGYSHCVVHDFGD